MDDLKLFSHNKKHFEDLTCVGRFSTDICMKFGLDKCKMSPLQKERYHHERYEVGWGQRTITRIEEEEMYKYIGYLQATDVNHLVAKEKSVKTYLT